MSDTAVFYSLNITLHFHSTIFCTSHSVDVRDNINRTPLHMACEMGHVDLVKYLVEKAKCNVGEYR